MGAHYNVPDFVGQGTGEGKQRGPEPAFWRWDPSSGGLHADPPGSSHKGLKGKWFGTPPPTFLHQLLVGVRATQDQQPCQEHKGQDDAHHGASAQAWWVWVLTLGRQRS